MGVIELPTRVEVINIGLDRFETAVRDQGAPAIGVDWRIPAGGDAEAVAALARLLGPASDRVDAANAEVISRLDRGVPMLMGVETAGAVIGGFTDGTILHCGPSIEWADMCDPLQRSVRAAVVAEGWAPHRDAADRIVQAGEIQLEAANEHCAVVPMATAIGPTAPVYVVSVDAGGTTAYSSLNQGSGAVAWFGVDSDAAIERLGFLRDVLGPALAQALDRAGPIDVFLLAAQGIAMGDERPHAGPGHHQPAAARPAPAPGPLGQYQDRRGGRLPEHQPHDVPQHRHGRRPRPDRMGRAGARLQHRHLDGPQRHHLRRPPAGPERPVVHSPVASGAGRPLLLRPGTRYQRPRHRRQRRARTGRAGRGRRGQLSRGGRLPRGPHGRRHGRHRGHGPHLRRHQHPVPPPRARQCRHPAGG